MAFCIECGAKAPEIAKFCPQCGSPLVDVETPADETPNITEADTDQIKTETDPIEETPDELIKDASASGEDTSIEAENTPSPDPTVKEDIDPQGDAQISETTISYAPKSKAGLLIGLSLIALLVAGGGAYALGLFGNKTGSTNTDDRITAESEIAPAEKTPVDEIPEEKTDSVLAAYQTAIKSGRISDLGTFAQNNPQNTLSKDAELAAFASLQRQNSVFAFKAFTEFFPDADLSAYTGPRTNADVDLEVPIVNDAISEIIPETVLPALQEFDIPLIRPSLTARAEELDPFIAQGDTGYALSVIDEMLALPDLTDSEATYLLNLQSKTEAAVKPAAALTPVTIEPVAVEPAVNTLPTTSVELEVSPAPEITAPIEVIEPSAPAFDTAAKPIERFGAITPDEATQPGECDMTFSINLSGTPVNIVADCTDSLFIAPAKETVSLWSYSPALLAGAPVQQDDLTVKIKFHLEDTE